MPSIAQYMTRQPWTIRRGAKLSQARAIMREHRIRHLPVLEGGKLVGILSERDLYLMDRTGEAELAVEEAMTVDVYVAGTNDPVDEIVDQMAANKYGSVVVVNPRGNVEGIFTMVDGMQVLADLLRRAAA
jgi:acetoin utilization protein AcuB